MIKKALTFTKFFLPFLFVVFSANAQEKMTDANTSLHALKVEYPTSYEVPTGQEIKDVVDKVYSYLNNVTPAALVNKETGKTVKNLKKLPDQIQLAAGDFRLTSYEWGVLYAGMLNVGKATGDQKYIDYTNERFDFISDLTEQLKGRSGLSKTNNPMHKVMFPEALDHSGAMCAAMIKSGDQDLLPLIENYLDHISNKQFRLSDGTLARNRPLPNTIWLDDLFMSVPALAHAGAMTGEKKYFDDASMQVLQFSDRMFNESKKLFMHGWVQDMEPHPQFHWARANGWAIMAIVELLSVLPEDHQDYKGIMRLYQKHAEGLASYQDPTGFWHQLLDRNDSYLETSATAIYVYSISKGINEGWLDAKAYGPMVTLAWNAVTQKVNDKGQVEGTCVGTGMGFDPAFYYHRPTSEYAAHGYGPLLLAGGEVYKLVNTFQAEVNDSALMFGK